MMKANRIKDKLKIYLGYVLYYCSFQIVYQIWVTDTYRYQGFNNEFSIIYALISLLLLFFLISIIQVNNSPSSYFLHFTLAVIFIPSIVLFVGQSLPLKFIFSTFIAIFVTAIIVNKIRLKTIYVPKISADKIILILLFIALLNIVGLIYFGGLRYVNFNLSLVYDFRRDAAASVPGFFGYLNSITGKVVIPFGIVYSYFSKRWICLILFIASSFSLFALTHHKSPLFVPILILMVLNFNNLKRGAKIFPIFLTFIVVFSGIDLWIHNNYSNLYAGWFGALFANRTLLVPSQLNWIYFDFFSDASKYYWSTSKITLGLLDSPYSLAAPNLIGYEFFGNYDMSANTGWIGSGFANAGYLGILLYSFLLGLLLSFLDAYGRKLGDHLVFALFLMPCFTLITSADFTDMLLTHGLVFALLALIFLNPKTKKTWNSSCVA
jgi:oligosaccharide repeat unit polymerase